MTESFFQPITPPPCRYNQGTFSDVKNAPDIQINRQLKGLQELGLEGLRALWRKRYGPPPRLRSVELLRLSLAWRLQAEASSGLDRETKRKLKHSGALEAEGLGLGVGARLRREWQGSIVEVDVEADGFRWEDILYPSLSATATAITGTRWNGPRFFGLRKADQ